MIDPALNFVVVRTNISFYEPTADIEFENFKALVRLGQFLDSNPEYDICYGWLEKD